MREAFAQVWENPYVRVLVYLLLFYLAYRLLVRAWPALSVLLSAFAFAYLVHPLVHALEKRRIPRAAGVVLVYLLLGFFLALASFLAAQTVVELSRLARDLPRFLDPFWAWLVALPDRAQAVPVPESLRPVLQELTRNLQGLLQGFLEALVRWLQGLLAQGGNLLGFFASLLGGVFQLFTALVLSVYFLYDLPRLARAALALFPEPYQPLVQDLAAKLNASVGGYVRGQLLVALCVGVLVGVGFWLVGVPLAASLGFLAGVFNLIPFVGVVVSGVPALLLAATGGWLKALLALLVMVAVNQLEAHVLGPLIVGRATRLHPITAIAAILTGATLFGLWGALLGVPLAAFLKVLLEDYYKESRFYREG
ncbi:AI-2E family transporter [Thermus composti]|uniref:AI-2E family transporter n=1 Tax=Thermus composti TaxID=532059 RepID=A0ABV6Q0C6_9DEIN|nr:AI-2E family transporter [Thermus composti]GGM92254.1 AI-2E family transporter [Thermus composti]